MTATQGDSVDQAIAWHLRLDGASADDWVAFTHWLEADAAHAAAYDRIVTDDSLAAPALDLAAEGRASVRQVTEQRRRWQHFGGWAAGGIGAIAASLAAFLILPAAPGGAPVWSTVTTAPGEHRRVTLGDGTAIELNGGTRLAYAVAPARAVALYGGEATFHVVHDARHPFEIRVGGTTLRDMGTVFNVAREGRRLSVQVAEGAVLFRPDREAVTVRPGMGLSVRDDDDRVVLSRVATESVGSWRSNHLIFRQARLRDVAAAVVRATGQPLTASDAVAERPFTGSIRLTGDPARDAARLADLTGLAVRRQAQGWSILPVADAID